MPQAAGKKQKGTSRTAAKKPSVTKAPPPKPANAAQAAQQKVGSGAKPQPKSAKEDEIQNIAKVQVEQLLKEECDNQELIEEFICRICLVHVVDCNPKLTTCSHLFCGDCMDQWFASHQTNQTWAQRAQTAGSGRSAPCPVCKHQLHEGDSLFSVSSSGTPESVMLWRMLSSLKVACINHSSIRSDGKCCWTGMYGSYKEHIRACTNEAIADISEPSSPKPVSCAPVAADDFDDWGNDSATLCPPVAERSSPVLDAWDDADSDTHGAEDVTCDAHATEVMSSISDGNDASSAASEREQTSSSTESTGTSLATDGLLAVDSTDSSEAESLGKVQEPHEAAATGTGSPAFGGGDAFADLISCIGQLVELNIKDADHQGKAVAEVEQPSVHMQEQSGRVKVVHSFNAAIETQLSVQAGDFVDIVEQHSSGWTFGRKSSKATGEEEEGWFPHWAVSCK